MAFENLKAQTQARRPKPILQAGPRARAPLMPHEPGVGEKVGGMVLNKVVDKGVNAVTAPLAEAAAPVIGKAVAPLATAAEGLIAPVASAITPAAATGAAAAGTAATGAAAGGGLLGLAPLAAAAGPAAPIVAGGMILSKLIGGK